MESTEFNQAQMQLLEMMSFVRTPESLADLNKVISVPLKSGQININQTIPEKGKN